MYRLSIRLRENTLEMTAQVGRVQQHSAKFGQSCSWQGRS